MLHVACWNDEQRATSNAQQATSNMQSCATILAIHWPLTLEYFSGWQALLLFAALSVPFILLGLRSLSGLGPVRRWVALGARLLVLLIVVLILGNVRSQRKHKDAQLIAARYTSVST